MNVKKYKKIWFALKPEIIKKMNMLKECLVHDLKNSTLKLSDVIINENCDVFKISLYILSEEEILIDIDFALEDMTDNGSNGLAVTCRSTGFNATPLTGYIPYQYSEDFASKDEGELLSRVEDFEPYYFSKSIIEESLTDETLISEAESDLGVTFTLGEVEDEVV